MSSDQSQDLGCHVDQRTKLTSVMYTINLLDTDVSDSINVYLQRCQEVSGFVYHVYQHERASRDHIQGFIQFPSTQRKRIQEIKNLFKTNHMHIEKPRDIERSIAYCKKEDTRVAGPFEIGEPTLKKGQRNDIKKFIEDVQRGATTDELLHLHPETSLSHLSKIPVIRAAMIKPRDFLTKGLILYGPPGTGKTRAVFDNFKAEDIYVVTNPTKFDDYIGQKVVLFDEFDHKEVSRELMCKLVDRYPYKAPARYSNVQWVPQVVILTTNMDPDDFYPMHDSTSKRAFFRRFEVFQVTTTSVQYVNFQVKLLADGLT